MDEPIPYHFVLYVQHNAYYPTHFPRILGETNICNDYETDEQ